MLPNLIKTLVGLQGRSKRSQVKKGRRMDSSSNSKFRSRISAPLSGQSWHHLFERCEALSLNHLQRVKKERVKGVRKELI